MRSSRIIENLEQVPLLAGFDEQGQELDVVVQREPLLHEKMQATLETLQNAERQVPVQSKGRISKFRMYAIAMTGLSLTALTAPAVFAKYMIDGVYHLYGDLVREAEAEIDRLLPRAEKEAALVSSLTKEGAVYRAELYGYLKPHYESWWASSRCMALGGGDGSGVIDPNHMRWLGLGGDFFCVERASLERLKDHYAWLYDECFPIANAGCKEVMRHTNITQPLTAIDERTSQHAFAAGKLYDRIDKLESDLNTGFPGQVFSFGNGGWQITLGTGAGLWVLCLSIYLMIRKARSHRSDMQSAYQLINALPEDVLQSDEFRVALERADVQFDQNADLLTIINDFAEATEEAKLRDARRVTFLSASLPRNAGTPLHTFFHSSAGRTKDIKAMILEHADLLPARPSH